MGCDHPFYLDFAGYKKCTDCGEIFGGEDKYTAEQLDDIEQRRLVRAYRKDRAIRNARSKRFRHG